MGDGAGLERFALFYIYRRSAWNDRLRMAIGRPFHVSFRQTNPRPTFMKDRGNGCTWHAIRACVLSSSGLNRKDLSMKMRFTAFTLFRAAAVVSCLLPWSMKAQATPAAPIHNIVLVHGAWADGSSWQKLIPILEEKGYHVVCVQNPLTSFADDVAATKRLIDAQDGPVLLVGHSYGGAVITEAGNNPKVAGLVYVAAFAPDAGESSGSLGQPYGPTPGVAELRPIADGFLVLTPKGVLEDFAPDVPLAERKVMIATQAPTQGAALGASITTAAWRSKPSWFVLLRTIG